MVLFDKAMIPTNKGFVSGGHITDKNAGERTVIIINSIGNDQTIGLLFFFQNSGSNIVGLISRN